ncbi:MAG: ferritin-like domain-containing protein [Myxococcales bacterium]|nr:ferritin-like domain-containing protein [Myxococcales bacterium]
MIRFDVGPTILARFARELTEADEALLAHGPDVSRFDPEAVAAAHLAWTERIVDEFRSVVVFAELLQRMGECEAPFDALCAVHGLIGDELRHAAVCARVASWFGEASRFEVDLSGLALPPSDDPPAERALEIIVRELVVAEAESVTMFRAYRDATSDPSVRSALSLLLRDEVRHAAVGNELRAAVEPLVLGPHATSALARIADEEQRDRAYLRQTYFDGALGAAGRELGASVSRADLVRVDPAAYEPLSRESLAIAE